MVENKKRKEMKTTCSCVKKVEVVVQRMLAVSEIERGKEVLNNEERTS